MLLLGKRKWLKQVRERIYERNYLFATMGCIPPYAYEALYSYAYDVLTNSFPKEFVEELRSS